MLVFGLECSGLGFATAQTILQATAGLDFLGDSALSPLSPGTDLDLLLSEFWSRRLP